MSENLRSINIDGVGTVSGGNYDKVSIDGVGKVSGDLFCNALEVDGSGKLLGNVEAKTVEVDGVSKFEKNLKALKANIDGASKILGDAAIEEMDVDGALKISGNLKALKGDIDGAVKVENNAFINNLQVDGALKVMGDLQGDGIEVDGLIVVDGLLNYENILLNLEGPCSIKEIGGSNIKIKHDGSSSISKVILGFVKGLFTLNLGDFNGVTSEVIEGDTIEIENCKVGIIRGKHIMVGEGCEIEKIEYRDSIDISPSSRVKEIVKL